MADKNQIFLYDTTLRDGAQTHGIQFSLEDKLKITRELDNAGFHYIEGGWPGSNPKDVDFFSEMKKVKLNHAKLAAFSSTRMKNTTAEKDPNIQKLIEAEVPVITIFGKSWDLHAREALGISLQENLDMISSTLEYLRKYVDTLIFDGEHSFDGYRENPEYAIQSFKVAEQAGADWVVLCDTNGGALPDLVRQCTIDTVKAINIPVGIHTHDDGDLSAANSLVSIQEGATMLQATLNGLGERCGNANFSSVVPNLQLKMGYSCMSDENLKKLTYLSRLIGESTNQPPMPHLPFVGERAFTHKGGIHVSAIRKNPRTYEHIQPELVGNKRNITVSEQAGKSNILQKAEEMGIKLEDNHARAILKQVKEMESKGYHYEGAEASFDLLTAELTGNLKEYFSLHGFRVLVWKDGDEGIRCEATIKAQVPEDVAAAVGEDSHIEHTSADGTGPVEALDKALRKVLEKFYPNLKGTHLTDYKVRILNEEAGINATTRVLISSSDGESHWGTVGASSNIIEASWKALVDSLNYKLKKDEESSGQARG